MIAFAPAKINIGLRIIGKRGDGFHDLESYLYPVPLYDILEITPSEQDELIQTGISSHASIADNIVFKAVMLLRQAHEIPSVKIHLHKKIPVEAGLGGGSSDAVATLKLLVSTFGLNISEDDMQGYAKELGSDCLFFIKNRSGKITGRGEHISINELSLKGKYVVIVVPEFSINTAMAFKRIVTFNATPLPKWEPDCFSGLTNDFEDSLGKEKLIIDDIKGWMLKQGAVYTSMSGSGSAVFGIFNQKIHQRMNSSYFQWIGQWQ